MSRRFDCKKFAAAFSDIVKVTVAALACGKAAGAFDGLAGVYHLHSALEFIGQGRIQRHTPLL